MARIVTYAHRPKRVRKRKPAAAQPVAAIVSASKPGKRRYESDPDAPVSDSVKAFFARMIRPPG